MRNYSVLQFFAYHHLPTELRETAKPFCDLAWDLARKDSDHPSEVAQALRRLLEAKDAAVRSRLPLDTRPIQPEDPQT